MLKCLQNISKDFLSPQVLSDQPKGFRPKPKEGILKPEILAESRN